MNRREITDLFLSWITISIAFAGIGQLLFGGAARTDFLVTLATTFVAVGAGFILHELAHKYVAIHFGAKAEFFAWKEGLLFAIVLALLNSPIIFAAPGAVYVFGKNVSVKQNGIISLAGPVTNLLIVLIFGALFGLLAPRGLLGAILTTTMYVNFFLAFFNMIPVGPLDGSKVFRWNVPAWAITIAIAASGVFFFEQYLMAFAGL